MTDLQQKTWFITGAGRGLGFHIASAALAAGEKVVVTGRDIAKLQSAYPETDRLLALALDVCDEQQIAQGVEQAVKHFGRIDVLVNNAGYGQLGIFEEIAADRIQPQFATNVFGLMALTRAVLPYMRQQRSGQIYNISSIGGVAGFEGAAVYCATKFAVEGFSASLAAEVKQFGISVTSIEPGFFRTDFLDNSSVRYGDQPLDDYREYSATVNGSYQQHNHQQAGDPAKLGQVLVTLSQQAEPPLHFAAGSDALQVVTDTYEARLKEVATWADLSTTTDFEA